LIAADAMSFPQSDHCDGVRFFNPGPGTPRGVRGLLRWRLRERRTPWPEFIEDPPFPPPPDVCPPDHAAITFIGHATFLIRMGGLTILTDPIFSDRCSPVAWAGPRRVRRPGLALAALPRVDVVLLSHNHYDHMDLPSLRRLHQRDAPAVVTTLGNARTLARAGLGDARELDWWQATRHGAVEITATPARHFARRGLFDHNRSLWAGFMLSIGPRRLLFAGDSGAGSHWADIRARLGAPGVALLPIGAYEPRWFMQAVHMNPADAVQAHRDLGAGHSIGMHFGTFHLTDEAVDAPAAALANALGPGHAAFSILGCGETEVWAL
jgi:L-ascorbate metabolism protein UlaG (beta-lactamase superfamily)